MRKPRTKQMYDAIKISGMRLHWIVRKHKRYMICGHVSPHCSRLELWYDLRIVYPKGRSYFFAVPSNLEYCERVFPDIVKRDSGMVIEGEWMMLQ